MKLTKREQRLIALLRGRPRTGAELADELEVSRRTITREVAAVNAKLVGAGAGRIAADPTYRLEVSSADALRALVEDGLSDELAVLLSVLTSCDASLTSVAQETFLSRRALAAAVASINREYAGVLRLEPRAGRGIEVELSAAGEADFLASLASENPSLSQRLEEMCGWQAASRALGDDCERYVEEMSPYVSSRQAHLQTIAAMSVSPHVRGEAGLGAHARAAAAREFYRGKRELLFELVTRRAQIVDEIGELLRTYGIRSTRSDLCALIFDHVVRCALFPTLMSGEMKSQMRDMRLRHPFEFDFGDDLSSRLHDRDQRLLIEPDFLALYVLASMEERRTEQVSILVLCHRRSMSTINQRFIEQNVTNADVFVVCDESAAAVALSARDWDLLVRDEDGPTRSGADVRWDMTFRGVLSSDELRLIRRLALDTLYRKNVARMLERENYLEVDSGEGDYLEVLEGALEELVESRRITADEAALVLEREHAGERLNLGGVALPHAITPVESETFRIFVLRPERAVFDGEERIELIIVVLASQRQADKSSIFSYLFSVIEGAAVRGSGLPRSYEETIDFLGKSAGPA